MVTKINWNVKRRKTWKFKRQEMSNDTKLSNDTDVKWHEMSNVTKMTWNIKWHEMANDTKFQMAWNVKWHKISNDTKLKIKKNDTWHMTHDIWQMTHDAWHMTHDTWCITHDAWRMKCQISRNADADAGYMTKRWYLSQSSQAALV